MRERLDDALRSFLEQGDLGPLTACASDLSAQEAVEALQALASYSALRAAAGRAHDAAPLKAVEQQLHQIASAMGALSPEDLATADLGAEDAQLRARLTDPLDVDPRAFVAGSTKGLDALLQRLELKPPPELEVHANDLSLREGGKVVPFPSARDAHADEWAVAAGEPEPADDPDEGPGDS